MAHNLYTFTIYIATLYSAYSIRVKVLISLMRVEKWGFDILQSRQASKRNHSACWVTTATVHDFSLDGNKSSTDSGVSKLFVMLQERPQESLPISDNFKMFWVWPCQVPSRLADHRPPWTGPQLALNIVVCGLGTGLFTLPWSLAGSVGEWQVSATAL